MARSVNRKTAGKRDYAQSHWVTMMGIQNGGVV